MEKLEYYLVGKEFDWITDHKAIKQIRSKHEFGTLRIQRWLSRLDRLSFRVCYRKVTEMIEADILSRNCEEQKKIETTPKVQEIFAIHEKLNHRKSLKGALPAKGITISDK